LGDNMQETQQPGWTRLPTSGLVTDLYELTMMQGYRVFDRDRPAVFDMFFRSQPFGGGYSLFAGLWDLVDVLGQLHFSDADIAYLAELGMFRSDFLDSLGEFEFTGNLYAMPEGTTVFPGEPLIRIEAPLAQAQLIETLILNIVNFQSLIATKAARLYEASEGGTILEFGLRRAQGSDGGVSATRAAHIGGAAATSNTYAGRLLGIPVRGTMAHSWVMSFRSEREAFERYAELYPDACTLLIDTYNTLESGLPNAIEVGKRLMAQGRPFGVRLDSGDLQYLSQEVRRRLDEAGLYGARIAVSNELDERIVHELKRDGAPVDAWGVGTHLVTGGNQASFPGVYKLAARTSAAGRWVPVMKQTDNLAKASNPGIKQVYRYYSDNGEPLGDLMTLTEEHIPERGPIVFYHPTAPTQRYRMTDYARREPLLRPVMEKGRVVATRPTLEEIRSHALSAVASLHGTYKRMINPHIYKVSLSGKLRRLKLSMMSDGSEHLT